MVDDAGWKESNISPMWKILMKDIDLGEPTSFLDHVYLGCTQRECQISKDIVDNYRSMFESRMSAGATEKYQKQCVERYCELANKTTEQLYKVATPCMDDHQIRENGSVGELSIVCSQIVLKCLFWLVLRSCGHKMDETM